VSMYPINSGGNEVKPNRTSLLNDVTALREDTYQILQRINKMHDHLFGERVQEGAGTPTPLGSSVAAVCGAVRDALNQCSSALNEIESKL
jgi:uncharacterized protein YoxC